MNERTGYERFTVEEVADLLKVDARTVRGWIDSKELRGVNLSMSRRSKRPRIVVFRDDLDLFLKSREVATAETEAPKRRTRPKVARRYW